MRQRVMIASALACNPELLIADEPTTALDVTIQAQILYLMRRLQQEMGMAIMFITHDLGIIAQMADRIVVMYAGQGVESGQVESIFDDPTHPYTIGLLRSIPNLKERKDRLQTIEGVVPSPKQFPSGCRFNPRCSFATTNCQTDVPPIIEVDAGHSVRCWNISKVRDSQHKELQ
jgi:oligopeptide/dipeptide ABC transporter ATP-binding protein